MDKDLSGLFLFGATHHTAPIAIREQIALKEDRFFLLSKEFHPRLDECLLLNTCNRTEIYGVSQNKHIYEQIQNMFCRFHTLDTFSLANYCFWKKDEAMIKHLFEVCSGLDSQLIGETEIFGQVKKAYRKAVDEKTIGKRLHKIFQKSFQAAKWIRTNTALNQGQVSIGNIIVELASRIFGHLEKSTVLVIGAGQVGLQTAKCLYSRQVKQLTIASRTLEKAKTVAAQIDANAVIFSGKADQIALFDIIICSTSSTKNLLTTELIKTALHKRPNRPLFLIDLSVPRNIDPNVSQLPNVFLYNLDDIARIANRNRQLRKAEVAKCHVFIKERSQALFQTL